jgi:hypothetical protein
MEVTSRNVSICKHQLQLSIFAAICMVPLPMSPRYI